MISDTPIPTPEDIEVFKKALDENRYDFCKLAYLLFPFGQKGHALEHFRPYSWQLEEWRKLSLHLSSPKTRYRAYRLCISSGNGAAKTAWGAMTYLMLMYTQRLRGRITANTQPQMNSIVWPEYDLWFRHARFSEFFFEKFGTSIKAKNAKLAETWRLDAVTWNEQSPASISGLHNKGGAIIYIFEEAPGIPSVIWDYAEGAFTETGTIKLFLAFGNSDDPESQFEQNMDSPLWKSRRIDTRELKHIDPQQIKDWLLKAGGDEDDDDFRVRVRGLPRKTAKDSIIKLESVVAALERRKKFKVDSVKMLPCILMCDPAWKGDDDTTIWYKQGNYAKMLDKYKLRDLQADHQHTFNRLCHWERELQVDAVHIDQGEGTGIMTLANNAQKTGWELIAFSNTPTDAMDFKDSEYGNIRAQMYYQGNEWLIAGGVLDAENEKWIDDIKKQLCWTKGTRHKTHGKKMAEPKLDIKTRVGKSPDVADGFVLGFARDIQERKWENESNQQAGLYTGQTSIKMPKHDSPYVEEDHDDLYN